MNCLTKNHKEFIQNHKLQLRLQERLRSKKHNIFTEEVSKIALSSNADKRIQPINSIDTNVVCKKKWLNIAIK